VFVADEDSTILAFTRNNPTASTVFRVYLIANFFENSARSRSPCIAACLPYDFKLIRVVFIEECDRNAHNTLVITGNILGLANVDGIIVIVVWIIFGGIPTN
jgi:hypothetical protein